MDMAKEIKITYLSEINKIFCFSTIISCPASPAKK